MSFPCPNYSTKGEQLTPLTLRGVIWRWFIAKLGFKRADRKPT